jgi:exonuclease III
LTANEEAEVKNRWGHNCYFSNGTNYSTGVVTIIPKDISFTEESVIKDDQGRYIILTGLFGSKKLTIVNMYAPTQDKAVEQDKFIEKLLQHLNEISHQLVWCGDFNAYLTASDKFKTQEFNKSNMVKKITAFNEDHDLCDVWRVLNPDKKRFTWRKMTGKGISRSRLDYIIVPQSFIFNIIECKINPAFLSDHNIVSISIAIKEEQKRGRGMWKFNNSLLSDSVYIKRINSLIEECETKYGKMNDKRMVWDVIKMEIRGSTVSYCSYKAKKDRETEKELLQEIKRL